jgi:hypothetical protein
MSDSQLAEAVAPQLTFAFEVEATLEPALELGILPDGGRRRIIPIAGGVVRGPELAGEVLRGGADWQLVRADGVAEIEARYTLRTDRGELISVTNPGYRHAPPDIMRKLVAGEPVPAGSYYFRTTPRFEVASERLAWMMRTIFVADGIREPDRVRIRFFRV